MGSPALWLTFCPSTTSPVSALVPGPWHVFLAEQSCHVGASTPPPSLHAGSSGTGGADLIHGDRAGADPDGSSPSSSGPVSSRSSTRGLHLVISIRHHPVSICLHPGKTSGAKLSEQAVDHPTGEPHSGRLFDGVPDSSRPKPVEREGTVWRLRPWVGRLYKRRVGLLWSSHLSE